MQTFKVGPDSYVQMTPTERAKNLKWWFILLIIVALLIAAWGLKRQFSLIQNLSDDTPGMSFVATAHAQAADPEPVPSGGASDPMRPYIMVGILSLIAVVTLICLGGMLLSKNEKSVVAAGDLLKMCIGFFIGIATSYFGPP